MEIARQVFTYRNFVDGVAGMSGGISAISLFYPLNKIRVELQTADPSKPAPSILALCRSIAVSDGLSGFFQGWSAQVVALGCSNFVYFYASSMIKVIVLARQASARLSPLTNLAVGAVAGVINVILTTPLWGVMTVLTTQRRRGIKQGVVPYKGMLDGLVRCGQEEGISGLWKGVTTNLILVSNPTVHYFVYDRLKLAAATVVTMRGKALSSAEFFAMGAIAKCIATIVTYPVQVAQSQLRNDRKSPDGKRKYKGTIDCLIKIYSAAGVGGWFRGMIAKLWQTVLTAAFQLMAYEYIRRAVIQGLSASA